MSSQVTLRFHLVRLCRLGPGRLGRLGRLVFDMVVLDGQAPDVEVVANGNNDVDNEATIDTKGGAKHEHDICHLVGAVTQGTRPPETNVLPQNGTHGIGDTNHKQGTKHVVVREWLLEQMRRDHAADRVGVDEADENGEGNEVVVEDKGLQLQVGEHEEPDSKDGAEAEEGAARVLTAGAAGADDVEGRLKGVEDEDNGALDEVPVGKGQIVDGHGDAHVVGEAKGAEHALLPDMSAAEKPGEGEDKDEDQDTFDRSVDNAEGEGLGVVLIPGLNIKGEESYRDILLAVCDATWAEERRRTSKEDGDSPPALAHVLGGGKNENFERGVEGIDAVVKEFTEGSGLLGAAAINLSAHGPLRRGSLR